ncbi:MAG: AAA family ATPase [Bacteroidales bacterium]|nr:AAA family ATPase [Bacteroidales bacterium]
MSNIKQTDRLSGIFNKGLFLCKEYRHQFLTPEHILLALTFDNNFNDAIDIYSDSDDLKTEIENFLSHIEVVPNDNDYDPEISLQLSEVIQYALEDTKESNVECLDIHNIVKGILRLYESKAAYLLRKSIDNNVDAFIEKLIEYVAFDNDFQDGKFDLPNLDDIAWKEYVVCMNEHYNRHNPLIGRKDELQRTIQILCRLDKNNVLHIGEPGVGKTSLIWGLARLIEEGNVPERLKNSRIYQVDVGTLLAGTQFRGDFENRIKQIMDGIQSEGDNNIVYIDEIHTLVGAGSNSEGSMDASNMLKPYLETGAIRFIGSTTYEEYNKHFSRSKGLIRRFQQIDILEPSIEETKNIIKQLLPRYEEYHNVVYSKDAISYAVEASAKYINDRFLPDKAIDLIDEAGAVKEIEKSHKEIGKSDIADLLSKTCKVSALADADDNEYKLLSKLSSRMLSQIYGQDEAVKQVVEAVQMSRAGLLDENKPLASLLFVGPTGVGKTELACVLSKELSVDLIRFDMSEYTEKHSVAKLIGSPAGYVGYEDGGLLTDAIRKSPNCVLLLDEIEKAHQDIYDILLQVMDYARLTDNKGRQADFRNVIIIMTTNAGAQFASQASVGFAGSVSRGDAMMKQVKKTFKPEFINRLSGTVVFKDMDRVMAKLILKKKLKELEAKLKVKNVKMKLTPKALDYLLNKGYTVEYGAREMDRVIAQKLKPILMREILFGSLKNGGEIKIDHKILQDEGV